MIVVLIAALLSAPAQAQRPPKGERGFDAAGFLRFYDAAKAGLGPQTVHRVPRRPAQQPALVVPDPVPTPEYRWTFKRMLARTDVTDRYDELIIKYSQKHKLDARFVKAIIAAESEFRTRARSPRGAKGLMQVMPKTAENFGVDGHKLHEAEANIAAGTAYLAYLYSKAWEKNKLKGVRYHEAPIWLQQRIIAAYNAGPRAMYKNGGWLPQTQNYVRKVLLFYHSSVTDFRRVAQKSVDGPGVAPRASAGTLY